MQQTEVQSSLIAKINEAHQACCAEGVTVKEAIIRAANKMRECGIYLQELKSQVRHGEFERLFSDHPAKSETSFAFTSRTAQHYMRFAGVNVEPVTDIAEGVKSVKDLMVASNVLPARTHTDQKLHVTEDNFFISAGKQLMAFSSLWEKQMMLHPIENWSVETAEQFIVQIEPVIEKINTIYAQAKERAYRLDAA